jgi:hypothetical protein
MAATTADDARPAADACMCRNKGLISLKASNNSISHLLLMDSCQGISTGDLVGISSNFLSQGSLV